MNTHITVKENRKKLRSLLYVMLCSAIYFLWFFMLEEHVTTNYHIIHVGLDDYIPFCEYFIVPYLFWFVYVIASWTYFYVTDQDTFNHMSRFLFAGMFISLFICTIYPNGTDLRPSIDTEKNVFTMLTGMIWGADTPTNVLPSIHVYNSIGVHIAISHSRRFREDRKAKGLSLMVCILICLSTVFLKQHSCADVLAAGLLSYTMYQMVYVPVTEAELKGGIGRRRRFITRQEAD